MSLSHMFMYTLYTLYTFGVTEIGKMQLRNFFFAILFGEWQMFIVPLHRETKKWPIFDLRPIRGFTETVQRPSNGQSKAHGTEFSKKMGLMGLMRPMRLMRPMSRMGRG